MIYLIFTSRFFQLLKYIEDYLVLIIIIIMLKTYFYWLYISKLSKYFNIKVLNLIFENLKKSSPTNILILSHWIKSGLVNIFYWLIQDFKKKSFPKNLSLLLQIMLDIAECTDHVRISSVYQILQLCYIDCVSK